MKFENVGTRKSGRSIVIDFQVMNVHTGWYVRQSREEANLIIGRGNTASHGHQGRPAQNSMSAMERTMDFHTVERVRSLLTLR
jgi:hypothetical protein